MRTVVKVGSSSLHDGFSPRFEVFRAIADDVAELSTISEFVIVSSGAILFGRAALRGIDLGPDCIEKEQLMASVGQRLLMEAWHEAFIPYGEVGQILVTNQELLGIRSDEKRHLTGVLELMLSRGVRPIVNENDAVAVDEIKLGDNDKLSAHLAHILRADMLFLLGQEEGFYENYGTESQALIRLIMASDLEHFRPHAGESLTGNGTGGMGTKFDAASIFMAESGRHMNISTANGSNPISKAWHREQGTMFES
jgi:glutamate 5-kinase